MRRKLKIKPRRHFLQCVECEEIGEINPSPLFSLVNKRTQRFCDCDTYHTRPVTEAAYIDRQAREHVEHAS